MGAISVLLFFASAGLCYYGVKIWPSPWTLAIYVGGIVCALPLAYSFSNGKKAGTIFFAALWWAMLPIWFVVMLGMALHSDGEG